MPSKSMQTRFVEKVCDSIRNKPDQWRREHRDITSPFHDFLHSSEQIHLTYVYHHYDSRDSSYSVHVKLPDRMFFDQDEQGQVCKMIEWWEEWDDNRPEKVKARKKDEAKEDREVAATLRYLE